MRAGRYDVVLETGAAYERTFQIWVPDVAVAAKDAIAGDRLFYKGHPLVVHSVVTNENPNDPRLSVTSIVFGQGLWWEPVATFPADGRIMRAVKLAVSEVEAAFTYVDVDADPPEPPVRMMLPTRIDDGTDAVLVLTEEETRDLGAIPGAYSWDLYANTSRGWVRVVEGTLTVIWGDARNDLT